MKADEIFTEIEESGQLIDDSITKEQELRQKLICAGMIIKRYLGGGFYLDTPNSDNHIDIPVVLNWLAGLGFVADGYVKTTPNEENADS